MTDAIATNNIVVCNKYITKSNGTKDTKQVESQKELQDNSTINIPCNVISINALDGIIVENITSRMNVNDTLQTYNDSIEIDCLKNPNITTDPCKKEKIKTETDKNGDTVLKYVYKKSDKTIIKNKSKGHVKNSIVRRKRSVNIEPTFDIKSASPTSIEYTTSHDIKEREELASPQYKSGDTIKKTDLANFNIETLHKDSDFRTKIDKEAIYDKPKSNKSFINDDTSKETQEYDKTEELTKNTKESTESDSSENGDSNKNIGSKSYSPYLKEKENINESNENSDELVNIQINKEIGRTTTDSAYIPKNNERNENYKHKYAIRPSQEEDVSVENNSESNVYSQSKSNNNYDSYEEKPAHTNISKSLQDVDLGDFSYETIQVNDKGKVEPTKDLHENYNADDITQTPNTQPLPQTNNNKLEPLTIDIESSTGDDFNGSNEQPVNINDGEVKPVVELNNDDDSTVSSEESSKEQQNSSLEKADENNSSSEEEQINSRGVNEKIIALKANDGEKVNVKQQVERIPLDYNHDDKSHIQKESENTDKTETRKVNKNENNNDGTLDSLTPIVDTYDDNLNIKFDDIALKLPDINLPDDILSYSRIGAPKKRKNKNKNKNKKFYHYSDEESEENQDEQKEDVNNANDNHNKYGIYNSYIDKDHENYKISNSPNDEDEDDVDLYEKFVRERFGKKSSFRKRSEKLQALEHKPSNPKLLKTIENILKQTEKVRDDAEKSGDPKAGYMWTLEYGENH